MPKVENGQGPKGDDDGSDGFTGESEDCDPDNDTHITWKYFKRWIGVQNTAWDNANNWEGGTSPKDCTCLTSGPCDDVIIEQAPFSPSLNINACTRDLQLINSGRLSLNNKILTITGSTFRTDNATFDPGTGTVKFTGTELQTVNNALNPFYNMQVEKSGGLVKLGANLTVQNNLTVNNGTVDLNGYDLTVQANATLAAGTSLLVPTYSDLSVSGTSTVSGSAKLTGGTLTTSGTTSLSGGTVELSGTSLWTASNTVSSSGSCKLTLQDSAELNLNASATLALECSLTVSGTDPVISGSGALTINGSVNISKLTFSNTHANGLTINDGSKISALDNVSFANPISSGRFLFLDGAIGSKTFVGLSFAAISGTGKNIVTNTGSTGTVVVSNYSGAGSGSAYTQADGASVTWAQAKVWAGNYEWKLPITVTNTSTTLALPSGSPVEWTFDHAAMITNGYCKLTNGDDFRIFFYDSATNTAKELDRILLHKNHTTGWNTANTTIAFATQESIPASGNSSKYFVVCGNSSALSPPANQANTGVVFFDGLESGGLTAGGWQTSQDSSGCSGGTADPFLHTAPAANSGTYWLGMKIGEGWQGKAFNRYDLNVSLTGKSNVYLFYSRSTDEGAAGGPPKKPGYLSAYSTDGTTFTTLESNTNAGTTPWTAVSFSLPNTAVKVRLEGNFSDTVCNADKMSAFDDVRIYANSNGSLPSVSLGTWASIKNNFSEFANWSPPGLPSSNDIVLINGGYRFDPIVDAGFTNTILGIEVNDTNASEASQSDKLILNNNLTVSRDVKIALGATMDAGIKTLNVGEDFENLGSFLTSGIVNFNGGTTQNLSGATTFKDLEVNTAGTKLVVSDSGNIVTGSLFVTAGTTLQVGGGKTLKLTGTTATVAGTLDIEPGATLDLADSVSLSVSGSFEAIGTSTSYATVTSSETGLVSGYSFSFTGSSFSASYALFDYMGPCGIEVSSSSAITLNNTIFDNASTSDCGAIAGTESYLLNFDSYSFGTAQTFDAVSFKNTGNSTIAKNVRGGATGAQHGVITFSNPSGGYAGATNESDPNNLIDWPATVTPDMASAVAADDSGGGAGIQYGDTVTLTFSEATNGFAITSSNIDTILALSNSHTWGSIVSASWSTTTKTNDTLKITLASDATVAVGDDITIGGTCPNTICDPTETNVATGSPPSISGTFGSNTPDMIKAEAADTSSSGPGIQAGDTVTLAFNKPTNAYAIDKTNIDQILQLSSSHSWLDGSGGIGGATWSSTSVTNDTLTIQLSSTSNPPSVNIGDTITISGTCPNTICDDTNTNVAKGSPPEITGTFGSDTVNVTSATAKDASGGGPGIQAGDQVVLSFDNITNAYAISASNIDSILPLNNSHTWLSGTGKIQGAVWSNNNKTLTVTLSCEGGCPNIAVSDSISLSGACASTICDSSNTNKAGGFPITIGGSFGTATSAKWKAPADPGIASQSFQPGTMTARSIGGTVYVTAGNTNANVYKYDASTGAAGCTYTAAAGITAGPVVFADKGYFFDDNGDLYKVDMTNCTADSTWTTNPLDLCAAADASTSVPFPWAIGGGTRVIGACGTGVSVRNDSDGSAYAGWATNPRGLNGQISSTISITSGGTDGYVFAATEAGTVYKLNAADGTVAASFSDASCSSFKSPIFALRGTLFIGCAAGTSYKFFAINMSDMSLKWSYSGASGGYTKAPWFTGSRAYAGNDDGYIYCLNLADGTVCSGNWPRFIDANGISTEVVYVNGWLYFGAGKKLYAISASDGSFKNGYPINVGKTIVAGPAVRTSLGKIYVGAGDGSVSGEETQVFAYDL